jgi:hypothetical protein
MKLDAYWKQDAAESSTSSEGVSTQKSEIESNILIQFRPSGLRPAHIVSSTDGIFSLGKLREGISSSQRHDQFAVEGEASFTLITLRS